MGDRGVITTKEANREKGIGIYLHWNGDCNNVQAFLHAAKYFNIRNPNDDFYGWARLTQIIANYIGGSLSIGIGILSELDTNGDNGLYEFDKDWNIIYNSEGYTEEDINVSEYKRILELTINKNKQLINNKTC